MGKAINWTDEQKEFIINNANKYSDYQLTELFYEKFGVYHPVNTIHSLRQRLGIKKGKNIFCNKHKKIRNIFVLVQNKLNG